MLEFYPQVKLLHVGAVFASGSLFLLRGLAVQAGAPWGMATPVRYLSYGIDTLLLTAALMLLTMLPAAVFANGWLWAKIALLVVYVGLGSFALKRGRTARLRLACYVAALAVFACMYFIARSHDPLGPLRMIQAGLQ
ncbi:MAG TPA: SirB2 family protein [Woeseiaceae bacterium]|nr:SirB2 family protein [Woeseiaceae bacterium]